MVDRPVFAFEPSFLDRLTLDYNRSLDPTNSSYPTSTSRHLPTHEADSQHTTEFFPLRPRSQLAERVASSGSTSSTAPGSLSFLRKPNRIKKSGYRPPSTGSLFSFRANGNSLNSLGSLNSMNSFLEKMNSLDSIKSVDSTHSGFSMLEGILKHPSTNLTRQVTPSDYDKDTAMIENEQESVNVTRTVSTTTKTSAIATTLPGVPSSSCKTAAYLMSLYTKARESQHPRSSHSREEGLSTMNYEHIVSTTTKAVEKVEVRTKKTSKRVAAKRTTVAKAKLSSPTNPKTKKRIRRKEPEVRKFVIATEDDVLLGRGGGSNHHPGNMIYRKKVLSLQPSYKTKDRDEKTAMSEEVVQWVQSRGGRFLKRESKHTPWYIVTDATARQKVSQALREDHTPEGRALKKSRTTYRSPASKTMQTNSKKKQAPTKRVAKTIAAV